MPVGVWFDVNLFSLITLKIAQTWGGLKKLSCFVWNKIPTKTQSFYEPTSQSTMERAFRVFR